MSASARFSVKGPWVMRVSIAMATHNGDKYLREQLESFTAQTRLPDELVVCDDCSTDRTMNILEDFAKCAPFPVRIYRNETSLGYSRNFERAISLCSGEIIFLSDQDDSWFPEKIEAFLEVFCSNESPLVVVCDALLTDSHLNPVGLTIVQQIQSVGFLPQSHVHGCCTAFRNELLSFILPVPHDFTATDSWIHYIGFLLNRRFVISRPLQYYRRHGVNTSDWIANKPGRISIADYLAACRREDPRLLCERRLAMLDVLSERFLRKGNEVEKLLGKDTNLTVVLESLTKEARAVRKRINLLRVNRFARFFLGLQMFCSGYYQRYFTGWKSFLKDLLW